MSKPPRPMCIPSQASALKAMTDDLLFRLCSHRRDRFNARALGKEGLTSSLGAALIDRMHRLYSSLLHASVTAGQSGH